MDDNYQDAPFKPGVQFGVYDCAREYCEYVIAITNAIRSPSVAPADVAHLIKALRDYGDQHQTLESWLKDLPDVPDRFVCLKHDDGADGYTDEGAPLIATVEDIRPQDAPDDEIPF